MLLPSGLLLALLSFYQIASCFVEFFEPTANDLCRYGNSPSYVLDGMRATGAVCAYNSDSNECYICPPTVATCWMWKVNCAGGGNGSIPGAHQTLCNNNGTEWCCNAVDECLVGTNQSYICNPKFSNPLYGISEASAIALALSSIIPGTTIAHTTLTLPLSTTTSTFFSASSSISSVASSSTSSSEVSLIPGASTTSGSTSISTLSSSALQSTTSAITTKTSEGSSDPVDVIGGIVLGVIAVAVIQH